MKLLRRLLGGGLLLLLRLLGLLLLLLHLLVHLLLLMRVRMIDGGRCGSGRGLRRDWGSNGSSVLLVRACGGAGAVVDVTMDTLDCSGMGLGWLAVLLLLLLHAQSRCGSDCLSLGCLSMGLLLLLQLHLLGLGPALGGFGGFYGCHSCKLRLCGSGTVQRQRLLGELEPGSDQARERK